MSHPNPAHDYSDEHREETHKEYKGRRSSALKKVANRKKPATIKTLKDMISEPASKDWFKKYGKK